MYFHIIVHDELYREEEVVPFIKLNIYINSTTQSTVIQDVSTQLFL